MSGRRAVAVALGFVLFVSAVQAKQYRFQVIPSMDPEDPVNPVDAAIGEAQMFLDVCDAGGGHVMFTYSNVGLDACSLTDVYVDDGSLLQLFMIHNTPGYVQFAAEPSPPELPRGQNLVPPFEAIGVFSADSQTPTQPMGVNPGESLGIEYSLQGNATLYNVLAELESDALRIGIHVQGFDGEGSEAFICTPEPGALVLLGVGGLSLMWCRRR